MIMQCTADTTFIFFQISVHVDTMELRNAITFSMINFKSLEELSKTTLRINIKYFNEKKPTISKFIAFRVIIL